MEEACGKNYYSYNRNLKEWAQGHRKNMPRGEAYLWRKLLKSQQMCGFGFLRQRSVLFYIADFMCKELMLIIEVDGPLHLDEKIYPNDKKRQKDLEDIGFTVLRFSDWEVLNRLGEVSETLVAWIESTGIKPKRKLRR